MITLKRWRKIASSTASRKAKGRKLQQHIRDAILDSFPELTERDVRSTPMGVTGDDIMLSETAVELFPYSVEAKNQESLSIWKALEQSEQEAREKTPLLVFKRNRTPVYVALEFEHFMEMVKKLRDK